VFPWKSTGHGKAAMIRPPVDGNQMPTHCITAILQQQAGASSMRRSPLNVVHRWPYTRRIHVASHDPRGAASCVRIAPAFFNTTVLHARIGSFSASTAAGIDRFAPPSRVQFNSRVPVPGPSPVRCTVNALLRLYLHVLATRYRIKVYLGRYMYHSGPENLT